MNDKFRRGVGVDTCEVGSFMSSYPVPELSFLCTPKASFFSLAPFFSLIVVSVSLWGNLLEEIITL